MSKKRQLETWKDSGIHKAMRDAGVYWQLEPDFSLIETYEAWKKCRDGYAKHPKKKPSQTTIHLRVTSGK